MEMCCEIRVNLVIANRKESSATVDENMPRTKWKAAHP